MKKYSSLGIILALSLNGTSCSTSKRKDFSYPLMKYEEENTPAEAKLDLFGPPDLSKEYNQKHFDDLLDFCPKESKVVHGYARSFAGIHRIRNAKITHLESGRFKITDQKGRFSFCLKEGESASFQFEKKFYKTIQTRNYEVDDDGLWGLDEEVTFQIPGVFVYNLLKSVIYAYGYPRMKPGTCNLIATITAYNKTLHDTPQGEAGAKLKVYYDGKELKNYKVLYYGAIGNKTNPFKIKENYTSVDGGALVQNLPPKEKPYWVTAEKAGLKFSKASFICRSDGMVNLSPPHGPRVLEPTDNMTKDH